MGRPNYYVFLPVHKEVTKESAFAGGRPILLDDGTILTPEYGALTENGKIADTTKSLCPVTPSGTTRNIRNSYLYRDPATNGGDEIIYTVYDVDGTCGVYYSSNGGSSWTQLGTYTSARATMRMMGVIWIVYASGSTLYVDTHGSSSYSTTSFGTINQNSITNGVVYNYYYVFSIGNYIVGKFISGSGFVELTDFSDSEYSSRDAVFDDPHKIGFIGQFPNLYIILAGTPKSTSTAYLYKLTQYNTTANSWVWEEYKAIGINPTISQTVGQCTFISTDSITWRFNHITGVMHRVRYNSVSGASLETLAHSGYSKMPYYTYNASSVIYKVYEENASKYIDECKSYEYINAYPSSAVIMCSRDVLRRFTALPKSVFDIFNHNYLCYPATYDFSEYSGSDPTIPNVTYGGWTSITIEDFKHHKNCLLMYEYLVWASVTPSGWAKFLVGSSTFDHGTVSFYFYARTNTTSVNIDRYLRLLDSSDTVGVSISIVNEAYDNVFSTIRVWNTDILYIEIDFECRTTGTYRGLTQYKYNFRVNGETIISAGSMSNNISQVTSFKLEVGTTNPSGTFHFIYAIDALASTGLGDHLHWNKSQGSLGFSGYLGKCSYKRKDGTANFDGIDKEIAKNSNDIPVLKQTTKELVETIIGGMNQIYQDDTIDPEGNMTDSYYRDYASIDYATIYDEINDLEDSIEYRDPTGRQHLRKITDIHDSLIVASRTSSSYRSTECDWDQQATEMVNRVVVYGGKFAEASGNIFQVVGVSEDSISIAADGLHEAIKHKPSLKTNDMATSVANSIRLNLGSTFDTPYKLVVAQIRGRKLFTGVYINYENEQDDVENADRIVQSLEYDYIQSMNVATICEGIIQDEDEDRMNDIRATQVGFTNEFLDRIKPEQTYVATDQIIFKNSISSIQSGIFNSSPVISTYTHVSVPIGVLGKDWITGDSISSYTNWTVSSATATISNDSDVGQALSITTSGGYARYTLPSFSTGYIEFLVNIESGDAKSVTIGILDSTTATIMNMVTYESTSATPPYTKITLSPNGGSSWHTFFVTGVYMHVRLELTSSTCITYIDGGKILEVARTNSNDAYYLYFGGTATFSVAGIGISSLGYYKYTNWGLGVVKADGMVSTDGKMSVGFHSMRIGGEFGYGYTYSISDFPYNATRGFGSPAPAGDAAYAASGVELPDYIPSNAKAVVMYVEDCQDDTLGTPVFYWASGVYSSENERYQEMVDGDQRMQIIIPVYDHKFWYYHRRHEYSSGNYSYFTTMDVKIIGYFA